MDSNSVPTGANNHGSQADDSQEVGPKLPQFLSMHGHVTLAALRERIETEFMEETRARIDLLRDADVAARREMIREVADYLLAVESLTLTRAERLAVLDVVYHDLFNLGPLAPFLADEGVTEFTIDGPDQVYLRYGAQDMVSAGVSFDDGSHLERAVQLILALSGTALSAEEPVLEIGAVLADRPARLTIFAPPVSPTLHVDGRLRPSQPATLDDCISAGLLDRSAADLLRAILAAGHGLMLVGDVGTGKTTLLEALLPLLPSGALVVERAAELRLPQGGERLTAIPPTLDSPTVTFAQQIESALARTPAWLILDEVRFDEAQALWNALTGQPETAPGSQALPRCLWAFRGSTDPNRLRAAFSMSVRRAQPGIDQELIHQALLDRLPFVATLRRYNNELKVLSIGEWQPEDPGQLKDIALRTLWPESGAKPLHPLN